MNFFIIAAMVAIIILLAIALRVVGDATRGARIAQTIFAGLAFFTVPVFIALSYQF